MPSSSPKLAIVKGHCPSCGPGRNAEVLHEYIENWNDEETGMWGRETFRMLKCPGCGSVYFQKTAISSEDIGPDGPEEQITYWPAPSRRDQPGWMFELMLEDDKMHSLFTETYAALNNDARVLAAIGLRTIFDRASEKFRVPTSFSFKDKLNALRAKGKIGQAEIDSLAILTDAGSAAAHRGWRPTPAQLDTLINIVESFVYRTFILDYEAKKLKKSIPKRKKKL